MGIKYCIGDVHGCYYTLLELIKKLPNDAELIFTGDLCDKGNFSKEVIQYIIDNNHTVIKGNHDYFMEQFLEKSLLTDFSNAWSTKDIFGGEKTIKSYGGDANTASLHVEFVKKLPYFIKFDNYFITHGFGLPYYKKRKKSFKQIISNRVGRTFPDWEDYSNYKIMNIFGHCDFDNVLMGDNYIGIDTGCVYGRKLTAIELGSHKIIDQEVILKDIE